MKHCFQKLFKPNTGKALSNTGLDADRPCLLHLPAPPGHPPPPGKHARGRDLRSFCRLLPLEKARGAESQTQSRAPSADRTCVPLGAASPQGDTRRPLLLLPGWPPAPSSGLCPRAGEVQPQKPLRTVSAHPVLHIRGCLTPPRVVGSLAAFRIEGARTCTRGLTVSGAHQLSAAPERPRPVARAGRVFCGLSVPSLGPAPGHVARPGRDCPVRPLALGVRLANTRDASLLPTPAPATPAVGTRAAAERGARPWDPPVPLRSGRSRSERSFYSAILSSSPRRHPCSCSRGRCSLVFFPVP